MNDLFNTNQLKTKVAFIVCDVLEGLNRIDDGSIDLIISSPPYNIGKSYEEKQELSDYLGWQEKILGACVNKLKTTGSLVWQVGNYVEQGEIFPLDMFFYPIIKNLGLKLRNRVVWHFDHGLHAKNRLSGRYETLLWFTKTEDYKFNLDPIRIPSKYPGKRHYKGDKKGELSGNPLGKNPSDFWDFIKSELDVGVIDIPNVKSNHPEKTEHPCQYPIELIERFVLGMTDEGDIVLDPFGGVGSTVIAAAKHNRQAIQIERNEQYTNIAKLRLQQLELGTLKMRPIGKPIHQPTGREKISQIPLEWIER